MLSYFIIIVHCYKIYVQEPKSDFNNHNFTLPSIPALNVTRSIVLVYTVYITTDLRLVYYVLRGLICSRGFTAVKFGCITEYNVLGHWHSTIACQK